MLDQAAWASLTGPHAHFAEVVGQARRYPAPISPIMAVPLEPDKGVWDDLRELAGPGRPAFLAATGAITPPDGWATTVAVPGVQLVATGAFVSRPDDELLTLGPADVPEMLDLVRRTEPGPFEAETYKLGTYLGVRRAGALVAMAGERLHPPGFTEISAVCTDAAHRGQGLATRLIRAVAHGIRARGETPFLHTAARNSTAIRLYEALGFELSRTVMFTVLRSPE